ncbi:hypothetical protein K501DRAFT_195518 [Backusella circina FSU 941]|nr:hypothetical protein K501DRAFT_195518 [Backusella circina FSU 941]
MLPTINCPATCELCGQWLPSHSSSCPRNGVHPSQWNLGVAEDEEPVYAEDDEQPEDQEYYTL